MRIIKLNHNRGITLIALIITVIILLILAGTAISISVNGGDLFGKAQNAVSGYNAKVAEENTSINSYLGYLDQYAREDGGDAPATGTLEVDYDLIADKGNTYKKVTLNISGLKTATTTELATELAKIDGAPPIDAIVSMLEGMSDEQLNTFLADSGMTTTESFTVTAKLNGSNIAIHNNSNNSFLATQNGTYEVTVRSASNKVGKVNVVIDGNNIGTTKEQSGINEEIFGTPSSVDYTDTNGDYARIPAGYYVGTSNTINKVVNGLVITSSVDESGHSTGDEYVWIPVSNINNMVMCKVHGANVTLDTTTLQCPTCGTNTKLAGKIYWDEDNWEFDEDATGQTWNTSDYHETDLVTNFDVDTTAARTQIESDFYSMAESVATYGGFYISRYEAQTNAGSKKDQEVLTAATNDQKWYGLYGTLRKQITNGTDTILVGQMIWGSQYDQVIKFIGSEAQTGHSYQGTTPANSGANTSDKLKNIFDLEGNMGEWTAEAYQVYGRTYRGGIFVDAADGDFYPASDRYRNGPDSTDGGISSRQSLYVPLRAGSDSLNGAGSIRIKAESTPTPTAEPTPTDNGEGPVYD